MNKTINDLKTRRSIRKFKDEQISDEDLKTILETGTYAPTGRGAQSPKIVVIQDEEKIKEFLLQFIRKFKDLSYEMFEISNIMEECSKEYQKHFVRVLINEIVETAKELVSW